MMKAITCPYAWDCGITFEPEALSEHDLDFLQNATAKRMTFMMLDCPHCSREFNFDTVAWQATGMGYTDPALPVVKQKKTVPQLKAILKKETIEIPAPYLDYLSSSHFRSELTVFESEANFIVYDLAELCEPTVVDGKSYLTVAQLKGFAHSLAALFPFPEKDTSKFTWAMLSECWVIGHEGTRLLFIDCRDSNALWIFHPDGGDVEQTNLTIMELSDTIQ